MISYAVGNQCPWCKKMHELATALSGHGRPVPGDVSICYRCAGLSVYDEQLALVPMGLADQAEFMQSEVYQTYVHARNAIEWVKR